MMRDPSLGLLAVLVIGGAVFASQSCSDGFRIEVEPSPNMPAGTRCWVSVEEYVQQAHAPRVDCFTAEHGGDL